MDDGSFETWYRAEHARVIGVLAAVSGDRDLSVEASDEAFTRALMHWDRVGRMRDPTAWTIKVALNVVRKAKNRRRMELRAGAARPGYSEVPPTDPDLWAVVRQLPRRQREAITLRYIADLDEAAIARVMGVRRGTVSASLVAARRRLASQLPRNDSAVELHDG